MSKFRTKPFNYNLIIYFPRVLTTINCLRALLSRLKHNKPSDSIRHADFYNTLTQQQPNLTMKNKNKHLFQHSDGDKSREDNL